MRYWQYIALCLVPVAVGCGTIGHPRQTETMPIIIGPFCSHDAEHHQERIQRMLDKTGGQPAIFQFAPGAYCLTDTGGLHVPSHVTLLMEGARFLLAETLQADGQAFLLDNASDVVLRGGEIIGRREVWAPSVNVAGIRVCGSGANITVEGLVCHDVSSNAVGVFGTSDDAPIRNVVLKSVTGINCCNMYIDYLQPNKGPVPGSDRRDQGTVALYYVDGWAVDACRFENSQSDGTHFFHCKNGQFMNSTVIGSKMGGYFLEGCQRVLASGNRFQGNGSRGVTIERDSQFCTLTGNLVSQSGREGLWMPDVCAIIVSANLFSENGRKDDEDKDCEIRLDETKEYATVTQDVRIEGNVFYTSPRQTAAIYTSKGIENTAIMNNTFHGDAPQCFPAAETSK
ncbi:MAG TPA: right-handed parallel beta-helix repeat-containing protein [Candidatus Hydrogenedentes bacterium]|nr:right-handed parallel beta-helix repeat-containing protein [Candidatus Hydrogenedentota bacterium]